jgi:hypothetical protein
MVSYATDILPYAMRAKGYTIMEFAMYITFFFNQYVNPITVDNTLALFHLLSCLLMVEVVVIYFLYVETRSMLLEEITKFFGEDIATATNLEMDKIGENGEWKRNEHSHSY